MVSSSCDGAPSPEEQARIAGLTAMTEAANTRLEAVGKRLTDANVVVDRWRMQEQERNTRCRRELAECKPTLDDLEQRCSPDGFKPAPQSACEPGDPLCVL
jgi:hypothetical protein